MSPHDQPDKMLRLLLGRPIDAAPPGPWKIGVTAVVIRADAAGVPRVLIGSRTGSHGAGTWGLPGGKPEPGETLFAAAVRELYEETGLRGRAIRLLGESYNEFGSAGRWCTSFVLVEAAGEPVRREPTKNTGWDWFTLEALPSPLFGPAATFATFVAAAMAAS
jgi:8-oxo-dGTP diphosphatase